jgi:hypothetical protein
MTQITSNENTDAVRPPVTLDIVKRAVPRNLDCRLTDDELLRIARTRTSKEAERDQLAADADHDAKKRKAQIKEYDDEILVMRRELHTGYQQRTIKTNEVFEKDDNGNCWIAVYRLDTGEATGERWPATAAEMQRYLPDLGPEKGLLAQAEKVQRSAQPEVPEGLPEADDTEGEGDDDEDEGDNKPARSRKKRS